MFKAGNDAITNIQNVALVTRYPNLAVTIETTVDGAVATADGMLQRGTILVPNGSGKWRPFVRGTDTLAADQVRIFETDTKMNQGKDLFGVGFTEGFFRLSSLVDANPGLQAADLTALAGFHAAGQDEVRLK